MEFDGIKRRGFIIYKSKYKYITLIVWIIPGQRRRKALRRQKNGGGGHCLWSMACPPPPPQCFVAQSPAPLFGEMQFSTRYCYNTSVKWQWYKSRHVLGMKSPKILFHGLSKRNIFFFLKVHAYSCNPSNFPMETYLIIDLRRTAYNSFFIQITAITPTYTWRDVVC